MTLSVGTQLPQATLLRMGDNGPEGVSLEALAKGRKLVIFALPGAYTGTCTTSHVPSFMRVVDQLKAKGVDEVICLSVNDPFVMKAWGESTGAAAKGITFLADADGALTKALGMDFTAPPAGLIGRSKRYAMAVENGKVTVLNVEASPGTCDISGGETMLKSL